MEAICDFCRGVRAVVYCKSDSARLCLRCDGCVHSANLLSRRHARSLLCEKCNSQSGVVRCLDEKLSPCQDCDWNCNGCTGLGHRREPLNFYTGCPSLAEFRQIWSSVLDAGVAVGGALSGNDDCLANCSNQREQGASFGLDGTKLNELKSSPKLKPWTEPSCLISTIANCIPYCGDQEPLFSKASNMLKGYSELKDCKVPVGDDLFEGLNINDFQLTFATADEIWDCSVGQSGYQFESAETDCILMENTLSITKSDGHIEYTIEFMVDMPFCASYQASSSGYPGGRIPSTMARSLSNVAGENKPVDYQDCGLSPFFLNGESPWESNLEVSCPQSRQKAKMRYNEKKKTCIFGKQIRYASRKARADTRKRVKGRFVKAGEAYDYDPLVPRNV
ncbi:zinc finger protein CONSTANS-LIKE 12-like isoform X3 [Hibiscus syriacus]|uniref:Zinc finger protein CONSTANS-LIKE 12-like isoform X3 n=1 Tax=Hibiscus syriacus TaxID=106335 RepID=A0A6A2X4R6_HIBSY|nr:zinc finger protein CONSTANS-LIKE 12-like isoform X3 [Hibiscus syriacus]